RPKTGRVGDPAIRPHRAKTGRVGDPAIRPHRAKTERVGDPAIRPHRAKTGRVGDPAIGKRTADLILLVVQFFKLNHGPARTVVSHLWKSWYDRGFDSQKGSFLS